MTTCIDLRDLAGKRYRLAHDPAYHAEHGERGFAVDLWMLMIPCQFGHFYPWGGERLAFSTNTRGGTAKILAALPFVRIEQDAEDGYTLSFDVRHFDEIAQIAKPHKQRQWTPEQKAEAAARLAKYAFPMAVKAPKTGPESTRRAGVDTSAVRAAAG